MSTWVSYEGKPLGNITLNEYTRKWEFYAEDLETLQTLFSLPSNAILDVEGSQITFKEFKEKDLSDISAFYPSREAWLLKNSNAKTIDEFSKAEREGKLEEQVGLIHIVKK